MLRHTWATLALQKGISLAAVQKILGHDRLTTTAIYLNLTDGHVLEEFEAVDTREADDNARADFTIEATLATWREMIENIAHGRGRPDLTHTLNYLSHTGAPIRVWSEDPLRKDLFFRYNQSLQEFVNASAAFRTIFLD